MKKKQDLELEKTCPGKSLRSLEKVIWIWIWSEWDSLCRTMGASIDQYPPEPTHSYDQEQRPHQQEEEEEDDYYGGPYGPTRVTMITEESFPYATTAEAHYAKEDQETME
ncbi:hypothetical protein INR49_023220, partial [Caranx melampygus]